MHGYFQEEFVTCMTLSMAKYQYNTGGNISYITTMVDS
jgi:hypothetical protein